MSSLLTTRERITIIEAAHRFAVQEAESWNDQHSDPDDNTPVPVWDAGDMINAFDTLGDAFRVADDWECEEARQLADKLRIEIEDLFRATAVVAWDSHAGFAE